MDDPLTEEEKARFLSNLAKSWRKKYDEILNSGAIDETSGSAYLVASFAAVLAGESFSPALRSHKRMLENLRHFV